MSWLLPLVATLALADPNVGKLVLYPSPGARVERFPRTEPLRIELGIYHNRMHLDEQMRGKSARWLTDTDALNVGGGIWFVTLWVERPDIGVEWDITDERMVLSLVEGGAAQVEPLTVPTLEDLVTGAVPRRPVPVQENALRPLYGDASTLVLAPRLVRPNPPTWTPPRLDHPWRDLLLPPARPSHGAIDRYREALVRAKDPRVRETALYRLGTVYQELDFNRDALYYLTQLAESGQIVPTSLTHLEKARAEMALGRWDDARDSCRAAWQTGARDAEVLRCLGAVSLYSSEPPPTETARLLADTDPNPISQLLAAQLLIRDRRYQEAATLLVSVTRRTEGAINLLAFANLGDALFARGDLDGAELSWRQACGLRRNGAGLADCAIGNPQLSPLLRTREQMLQMARHGPSTWAAHIPELTRQTYWPGAPGAEAHYLLAQIATAYGDQEVAALHLVALLDRHHDVAVASDVPDRLYSIATWRMQRLLAQDRRAEAIAFYRDYWRPELNPLITDTDTLDGIARALESLGLYEDALQVQREITAVDLRFGREDPRTLWALALLYVRTDHDEEALETLEFIQSLPNPGPQTGIDYLREGHVHRALGDEWAAARAYGHAMEDPETATEATTWLAILRAESNMCGQALPRLEEVLAAPDGLAPDLIDTASLARIRCFIALNHQNEAIDAAAILAQDSQDPGVREYAHYLASVAATEAGHSELPEPLHPATAMWAALLEEEADAEAFDARLQERLATP